MRRLASPSVIEPTSRPARAVFNARDPAQLVLEQLPLDTERRAAVCVWIAFLTRGLVERRLAAFLRATYADTAEFVAKQIGFAQATRDISDTLSIRHARRSAWCAWCPACSSASAPLTLPCSLCRPRSTGCGHPCAQSELLDQACPRWLFVQLEPISATRGLRLRRELHSWPGVRPRSRALENALLRYLGQASAQSAGFTIFANPARRGACALYVILSGRYQFARLVRNSSWRGGGRRMVVHV
jgi:hypothetical protein